MNCSSSPTSAEEYIASVLYRYCRAMDRIDPELGYSVWHEDGVADYGSLFKGSGRAFVDWVCALHRTCLATSHQITMCCTDVTGAEATSEAYVIAALERQHEAQRQVTTTWGRYLDRWSCRRGRWAIDQRTFVLDLRSETRAI